MFPYKKYLINNSDQFDPERFSFVDDDMALMMEEVKGTTADFKAEIMVYFLKDHTIQKEWEIANPDLVRLVKSKTLSSSNIESLFESCYNNPAFGLQLETYIKKKIAEKKS
jgi:hypothetical protein